MAKGIYFEWIELVCQTRFGPSVKHVAMALARYADSKTGRHAHPGIERLVADTSLSEKTVRRSLSELVDSGLIVQESRGGSRTRLASDYTLVHPDALRARWGLSDPEELRSP